MRIEGPRATTIGDRRRIEADVVFEDVDRPPLRVYIEAGPPLADALDPIPEAFVLPALPAAVWLGERRLRIDGALDPVFVAGVEQAMALYASWYGQCRPIVLEPTEGLRLLPPAPERHAAALCSGGVDALAMLKENWTTLPPDHGRYIRSAICIFGYSSYEFENGEPVPERFASFERNAGRLEAFAARFGCELSRVRTNATLLFPDTRSFLDVGCGATLIAPLIASPRRVTHALLGSSGTGVESPPHGTHPLLDGNYSTSATRVQMGQPLVLRHAKVGQISDWEPAFGVLHPCVRGFELHGEQVSCGRCEKCVRTMLSLLAWGALDRFSAFPADDVTPEMIIRASDDHGLRYMAEPALLDGLRALGRDDLVRAVGRWAKHRTESWWGKRRRRWRKSIRKRLGLSPHG